MPNQRDIAAALGLNQATVSMALRDHPRISAQTRQQVIAEAKRIGYRQNVYVSSLMQHIRSGRAAPGKICLAVIADSTTPEEWLAYKVFRIQFESIQAQAEKLGFYTECFFLSAPGMTPKRINSILKARNVNGLILGVPRHSLRSLNGIDWDSYASVGSGHSWQDYPVDIVSNHHLKNVEIAWSTLHKRGYKRIGMALPLEHFRENSLATHWVQGYIGCQALTDGAPVIPIMRGHPGQVSFTSFQKWYRQWKPDALLCPAAHEMEWLNRMRLRIPEDIAVVCLTADSGKPYSGVVENSALLGSTLVDMVVNKIICNNYGPSNPSKVTLIPGHWHEGKTIRQSSYNIVR